MLQSTEHSSTERLPSRRTNKPLVEKRRRERINCSLGQLKSLLLEAVKQDGAQFSRLEKADILEMTVKYLKHVQRQQCVSVMAANPTLAGKYRAGFTECAGEVMNYIDNANGVDSRIRDNLNQHLTDCITVVNTPTSATSNIVSGNASPSHQPSPRLQATSPPTPRLQTPLNGQSVSDTENEDCVLKQLNIQIPESALPSSYKQCATAEGYLLMPIAHSTPVSSSSSSSVSSVSRVQNCDTAAYWAGNENSKSLSQVQSHNNGLRCITNVYQSRFLNLDKEHAPHKAPRQMSTSPLTSKLTSHRQHPYSSVPVSHSHGQSRRAHSPSPCSFSDETIWRPW
ncbi:transcription factor HES-1-like [Gigantopelta aegis]|uniref:transcription factor HES-1-like n=1 Tax=Gigantopelta aegis TaxID=1735272 RepID=UPI001B887CB4|nr:transcription factor HES-1-like [Gigantopelta aegis]